jgi:hypothetical protein
MPLCCWRSLSRSDEIIVKQFQVKSKVYLETTILSYLAARKSKDPRVAERQSITRRWWDLKRNTFDQYVSVAVEDECARGNPDQAKRRLELLRGTSILPLNQTIMDLARKLVVPGGFPKVAEADSVHVAAATVYQCEYLLTWNIRHIANGEIRRLTERIIREHGYQTTTICTPEELFGLEAVGR